MDYYIGVDLGGTNIAAGLVDHHGKIILKKNIPTKRERGHEEIFRDIAGLSKSIIEESGMSLQDIKSIGVGSPGTIDSNQGVIVYANNLRFSNAPIRRIMNQFIDLPVYVENDANAAALGESVAGAARGYRHSLTITLGTGVGSGIIVDGKVFKGAFGGGGELGHHVIVVGGAQCTCGRKGCLEAYSSATALINAAVEAVQADKASKITEIAGNEENIAAKTVFDAADAGDHTAIKLVSDYIMYLAEGIANVINILQPEIVVIGGGVSNRGEKLLAPLRVAVKERMYGDNAPDVQIVKAILGNDAGIIGAAMLE